MGMDVIVSQHRNRKGWEGAHNRKNKGMTLLRKLGLCSGTEQASKLLLMRTDIIHQQRNSLLFVFVFHGTRGFFRKESFSNQQSPKKIMIFMIENFWRE